jgi:hypothetical protein
MPHARAPWWIYIVAASLLGNFALSIYLDFWGPEPPFSRFKSRRPDQLTPFRFSSLPLWNVFHATICYHAIRLRFFLPRTCGAARRSWSARFPITPHIVPCTSRRAFLRFVHPTRPKQNFRERDAERNSPDLPPTWRTLSPPTTQYGPEGPRKSWSTRTCESAHTGLSC